MALISGSTKSVQVEPFTLKESKPKELTGQMSVTSLVLAVLAFSGPMVAVNGYMPLEITVAGTGAPFAFILSMLSMLIFVVGYLAITKYIPKTGNFYLYVSAGLGKKAGLGSAFMAIASYILILGNVYLFLGITFTEVVQYYFDVATPWWIWSLVGWAIVSLICHLNVEFSAKFMVIVMLLEVLFIAIFNGSILFSTERPPLEIAPLLPTSLMDGNVVMPLLFGIMLFIGLEATTVYRDEVKNPDKTIPKATYLSIFFIGLIYTVTCYFVMAAYGKNAFDVATNNPTGMFSDLVVSYWSTTALEIKFALIATSLIASLVSINNVATRYIYGLAKDNIIPQQLAKIHDKHESPYIASIVVQIILVCVTVPFVMMDKPVDAIFANMAGLGVAGIIFLMALVSVSIIIYFRRNKQFKEHIVKTTIMPVLSILIMGGNSIFIFMNLEMVIGGEKADAWIFNLLLIAMFISGVALALYYKIAKPHLYQKIGQ